jgi:hypothetical protein
MPVGSSASVTCKRSMSLPDMSTTTDDIVAAGSNHGRVQHLAGVQLWYEVWRRVQRR